MWTEPNDSKMKMSKILKIWISGPCFRSVRAPIILLLCTSMVFASEPATPRQARVKDIASIEGIRDNQLVGYGIVVGLQGTGDSQQTAFPIQTLASTLLRMGVSVPASSIRVQNLAAVFVSATLPPFARSGNKLDITVSSAGDARSLEGGLLLMTPLYGADGKIYAQAQGSLVVGGYSVTANGNVNQFNHPNTARVPFGAMVERGVPLELADKSEFSLLLPVVAEFARLFATVSRLVCWALIPLAAVYNARIMSNSSAGRKSDTRCCGLPQTLGISSEAVLSKSLLKTLSAFCIISACR